MNNKNILSFICEKNNLSYILFSKEFKILDFSLSAMKLADDLKFVKIGGSLQAAFWEFVGVEKNILSLLTQKKKNLQIPMIYKNSTYYDTEIELFKTDTNEKIFIAHMVQKSKTSLKYVESIQEINKKTLHLQNDDIKEIKKNYYELINKKLITFQVDMQGLITEVNQVCSYFLGKESKDLIGLHFSTFFYSRESTLNKSKEKIFNATSTLGEEVFFHADIIPVKRNDIIYENIIICQDVTYLKHIEKELAFAAAHDSLTGLVNRTQLLNKIDEAIEDAKANKSIFALCYIDLDNFKPVNDAYGHHAGDMLLKHISSILLNFVRDIDTVSRIGGDKFMILLKHIENEEHLRSILKRINELATDNPLLYSEDDTIEFGFSLGTSLFPQDAQDAISLLNLADKAMYRVKQQKNK